MKSNEKVVHVLTPEGDKYMITSPATGQYVIFDKRWTFNGDMDKPTFRPSMLMTYPTENKELGLVGDHFFVTDGKIQYLNDCHHEMAGKTVDMIDCDWFDLNWIEK